MNETNNQIILDSLAETIRNLRMEVFILKSENERLKEKIDNKEGIKNA